MTLAAGIRLGPYKIVAPIGAGGMGEVYRARDTRLERDVAIKVLPASFASDPERLRRFEKEARAASALNHPNIIVVHDIGSATVSLRGAEGPEAIPPDTLGVPRPRRGLAVTEGTRKVEVHYLVEELLEGQTLRELLGGRPVPMCKAVSYAVQIAHGLAAAHTKGIVHRDLKPENVFITSDGQLKILDFGLAKLVDLPLSPERTADGISTVVESTEAGAVLGTVGYMSPEQVRGERIDQRSDVFAFGCVLFEMLTGQRAFKRATAPETLTAILKEPVPEPSRLEPSTCAELDRIVSHCLEKRPEDRFQSAHDLAFDLTAVVTGGTHAAEPARTSRSWPTRLGIAVAAALAVAAVAFIWQRGRLINRQAAGVHPAAERVAVLPFVNLGVAEDAYFASGVADEITGRLAGVHGLAVVSPASASKYAGTTKSTKQIGEELQAGYLLTGTVRWARGAGTAEHVRITPQLVRVVDDTSVWGQVYDFAIDDIFRVQSEIARAVVEQLGLTLLAHERGTLEARPTANLEAYQIYLRGKFKAGQPHFTLADWLSALDDFQRATTLDPNFALAWAQLAKAHARLVYYRYDISPQRRTLAQQALDRARALAGNDAQVHLAAGYYHLWVERNVSAALTEFEAASGSLPSNTEVLEAEGELFRLHSDWQRALETFQAACALNPRDAWPALEVAETLWWLRRYSEADAACDQAIALAPEQAWPHLAKVFNLWSWKGRAGLAEARAAAELIPKAHEWWLWAWFWQEVYEGRYAQALALLDASPDGWIRLKLVAAPKEHFAAFAHSWLGDARRAEQEWETARRLLEAEVRAVPEDGRYHSSLGVVYAALGRREEAVREGMRGVALLPVAKDAVYGQQHVFDLAHIYTLLGEDEKAIVQLEILLSHPGWITVPWLQGDPRWRPLDQSPSFQALCAKYQVKE